MAGPATLEPTKTEKKKKTEEPTKEDQKQGSEGWEVSSRFDWHALTFPAHEILLRGHLRLGLLNAWESSGSY